MGSKTDPGNFDCYDKALPNEPMFILLGRDINAPATVRKWADEREASISRGDKPETHRAKVAEARACADKMEQWETGEWRKTRLASPETGEPQAEAVRRVVQILAWYADPTNWANVAIAEGITRGVACAGMDVEAAGVKKGLGQAVVQSWMPAHTALLAARKAGLPGADR